MAKCKCGKSDMTFKNLSDMDGKWECELCPKEMSQEPKKEIEDKVIDSIPEEKKQESETEEKPKKRRNRKKSEQSE